MFVWWVRLLGWAIGMGVLAIFYNIAASNADEYGVVAVVLCMIILTGRVAGGVLLEFAVAIMWVFSRKTSRSKINGG